MYNPSLDDLLQVFKEILPNFEPRSNQLETAQTIIKQFAEKNHVVLEAPTGAGKSIIAMIIAKWFESQENRTVITSVTKSLQDQYLKDFGNHISDVRSSSNEIYRCEHGLTRKDPDCVSVRSKKGCNSAKACPYKKATKAFFENSIGMTNLHFCSLVPHISKTHLLILDECHELSNIVISNASFKLTELNASFLDLLIKDNKKKKQLVDEYGKVLDSLRAVPENTVFEVEVDDSAINACLIMQDFVKDLDKRIKQGSFNLESKNDTVKKAYSHLKSKERDLSTYIKSFRSKFVCQPGLEFKPIYASHFTNQMVFKKSSKFLHMSATICGFEQYCQEVGIDVEDSVFVEADHTIPIDRRKVILDDVAWMSFKNYNTDIKKTCSKIKQLIHKHDNVNTIIHTTSYSRANDINKAIPSVQVYKTHPEIVNYLNSGDRDRFVASPSITAGIDAKDDMCRLNIVVKLAFPSLGDPRMKYLADVNPDLYNLSVVRNLVQACGRSTRSQTDHSTTYIIDGNANRLFDQYEHMFPNWFKQSCFNKNQYKIF